MFLDSPRQSNLLPDLGARGRRQLDLGQIGFDAQYASARGRRPDVDEQQLVLDEFRDLGLFLVLGLDAE
jgi:hypothetical protein